MPPTSALARTWRYTRHWAAGSPPVDESEVHVDRGDRVVPASVFRPADTPPPTTAWIALHGITRPGRAHPSLLRFARALAASGSLVVVPEVPEWIELSLAPGRTLPTVVGTLDVVEREWGVPAARTGLMGFSFGAPQALVAASDPRLAGRLAGVAGFGGYCDLEATFRYLFTGVHEWRGERHRRRPDPYGRWIVAANFLLEVPGYAGAVAVRDTLLELARRAGELQVPAWDPVHDPLKARLRADLDADDQELFDRFAPPSDRDPAPPDDEGEAWASRLAEAGRRVEPLADPTRHLGRLPDRVHLLHGRGDDLIPYTETLRLAEELTRRRPERAVQPTITRLFAHSTEERHRHPLRAVGETVRFARALARVLGTV